MKRPNRPTALPVAPPRRPAYTLVEILTATVLTLMMMAGVVTLFGSLGNSVNESRELLETTDRLRTTQIRLQQDLAGATTTMLPPRPADGDEGYFEYTEGPIGPLVVSELTDLANAVGVNIDTQEMDSTVGDIDDMLMFTVRSQGRPFVGRVAIKLPAGPADAVGNDGTAANPDYYRYQFATVESHEAEVCWSVRGRTLYRRVLLILPRFPQFYLDIDLRIPGVQPLAALDPRGFHNNDVSIRLEAGVMFANTLADLTKPENRFAHRTFHTYQGPTVAVGFPYHPYLSLNWQVVPPVPSRTPWSFLGLPTARECSYTNPANPELDWIAGGVLPSPIAPNPPPELNMTLTPSGPYDAWITPHPWAETEADTGTLVLPPLPVNQGDPPARYLGLRIAEDVILPNVVGFDVKAWDPGAPMVMDSSGSVALMPGDPAYLPALRDSIVNNPVNNQAGPNPRISYGAYVDLNYMCLLGPETNAPGQQPPILRRRPLYHDAIALTGEPEPHFYGAGNWRSRLRGTPPYAKDFADPADWPAAPQYPRLPSVYDTWSTHYENDMVWLGDLTGDGTDDDLNEWSGDQDTDMTWVDRNGDGNRQLPEELANIDEGTNGFDDDNNGIIDDVGELETRPPYPVPLRGIQVKIRVFEPDSRQVREVTVVQDFLPK